MKYILDDKEYQKLHQSNTDLKKHNKVLTEKIKDLQSQLDLQDEVITTTIGEKSAEDMFKELSYIEICYSPEMIAYQHSKNKQVYIEFLLLSKCINIFRNQETATAVEEMACYIGVDEIKAINKQIQELGW
jgi:hypothetical protein